MNGLEFIKSKQQNWARRKGFELVGGTIPNKGEKNYLSDLANNLFEPLTEENVKSFDSGAGNETKDCKTRLAKMKALHSSSAIVVNLFQYWQEKDPCPLLNACRLTSKTDRIDGYMFKNIGSDSPVEIRIPNIEIRFEEQFEICKDKHLFPRVPNIDVIIYSRYADIAIESKFLEPYDNRKHKGLKQKYIDDISFWDGLPNLNELAKEISPDNNKFRYLDAAQLIKHILGLKKKYSNTPHIAETQGIRKLRITPLHKSFCLLYLWYDVLGKDGFKHREEIEQFAKVAEKDNIRFKHITYQEVIAKLSRDFYQGNEIYCNYLTDRYL